MKNTKTERLILGAAFLSAGVAFLTTLGIVLSLVGEAGRFFSLYNPADFFFGTNWSAQSAAYGDGRGAFGAVPVLTGTLLITAIALSVALPIGVLSALYLSEYAHPRARNILKPLLEVLAGIPTVVYGYFAVTTISPLIKQFGANFGLDVSSESALAAGLTMGIMIIPYVSSLSDDVFSALPQTLRDGSYALGALKTETCLRVIIPAAAPGLISAFILAFSRAIGETMIVLMAAGLSANLTLNPLESVTTFTVQISGLLTGDQEFDSPKTLSAFALGFVLFLTTLTLNAISVHIIRKYRNRYD